MAAIDLALTDHLLLIVLILSGAGFVHGLLGIGFPLLATPLLALVTDMRSAVLLLLIPTMAVNVASIWRGGRWGASLGRYWPLALFVAAGGIAGTRLLIVTPTAPYKLLMAGVILVYLNAHRLGGRWPWVQRRHWTGMLLFGLAAGLLAGTVNAAVPALIIYGLELQLPATAMVQVFNLCFLAGKLSQAVTFGAAGMFSAQVIATTLPLALLALVGLGGGMAIRGRIATGTYHRWLRRILFLIALLLIVQYGLDINAGMTAG
jgi:uncharacterized membrane protein YfcA